MIFSIEINNCAYRIDTQNSLDISIPLRFNGAQPNAYGVEKATAQPCEAENLIGDTRRGGSCNFEQVKFIPHCNGTHTESIGHITNERISVRDSLREAFVPAALLSVEPEKAGATNETYAVELHADDELITRRALEKSASRIDENFRGGLIVRTLPNDKNKLTKTYLDVAPPFFSTDAMRFIVEREVRHLLVDTPSIDRIFDAGKLSNHRIFWNVREGEFAAHEKSQTRRTITELIYVADEIADGIYLLNLQIAPFASDASPSRPLLFPVLPA